MKRLGALAAVALLASSCAFGTLGREFPRCDFPFVDIPISIIMELQALPDASWGPCLNELEPGWTYNHMQHQTGEVRFWLDSDRLGDHFLTVTLAESCDPGSAAGRQHANPSINRFVEATAEIPPVDVVIVPMADSAIDYAAAVGVDLSGVSVRGRPLALQLEGGRTPAASIVDALARGAFVIAVTDADASSDTVQLSRPGDDEAQLDLTLVDALEEIDDRVEEGSYHATWFHLFEGGCVTFEFDAEGDGVENLVSDVDLAIGFVDLADIKAKAAEAGLVLDESELDG